ncbi:hypothetical protein Pelo_17540 [Pelomyxa schiedti]|nr:hypothetical protein Pelo_17540 [Pelomyxa schiedti]
MHIFSTSAVVMTLAERCTHGPLHFRTNWTSSLTTGPSYCSLQLRYMLAQLVGLILLPPEASMPIPSNGSQVRFEKLSHFLALGELMNHFQMSYAGFPSYFRTNPFVRCIVGNVCFKLKSASIHHIVSAFLAPCGTAANCAQGALARLETGDSEAESSLTKFGNQVHGKIIEILL